MSGWKENIICFVNIPVTDTNLSIFSRVNVLKILFWEKRNRKYNYIDTKSCWKRHTWLLLNKNHGELVILLQIITHLAILPPTFPRGTKEMARENNVPFYYGLSWNLNPNAKTLGQGELKS